MQRNAKVVFGMLSAAALGAGAGVAITQSVSNQRFIAMNERQVRTSAELSKVNLAHENLMRVVLLEILSNQLSKSIGEIMDTDTLESLGADSLDKCEVVMAIEETFMIDIVDVEAEKLTLSPIAFMVKDLSKKMPRAEAQQGVQADRP